ncbi:MAG: ferritin-like domain-containing protein [Polyangiaceae bacterium]
MTPRELVRRSLFAGLGLGASACAADARTSAGGDIVEVVAPSARPLASSSPSASIKRHPQKPVGVGYVKEENGLFHRAGPTTCDTTISTPSCKGTEQYRDCTKDSDCSAAPHGKCTSWLGQVGEGCSCSYACETDADCASQPDTVCVCKDAANMSESTCVRARCKADDECTSGLCGVSRYDNGCGVTLELACKTLNDDCASEKDCKPFQSCAVGAKESWTCMSAGCVIGRPLVVADRWARADAVARTDWTPPREPRAARRRDAAFWSEMAALEHASVASFARFSLALTALGAPSALVRDTYCAALDEIEHAKIAYGFASAALGRPIGPGPLPEATVALDLDPSEVARALVVEGCIGETLGAIEALEESERTSDPDVARSLRRIGEDELRHAELAFRALAWLATAHGTRVSQASREALDAYRASPRRRDALRGIVRPLVTALTTLTSLSA